MQFIYLSVLFKRIKAIKSFMKDKNVPLRKKFIIVAGFLYLLSPFNLIFEPVLIFGQLDEIVLWLFIIWYLKDELDKYWVNSGQAEPAVKFHGKKIIDDVNFKVEDDEKLRNRNEEQKQNGK